MAEPIHDLRKLSAEKRIALAEPLWDSLSDEPGAVPLTAAQAEELDRRVAAYRADQDPGTSWREVIGSQH